MIAFLLALLMQTALPKAPPQIQPQIQRLYDCNGKSPNGDYQLQLMVERKGDNYYLGWSNSVIGMGFRQGNYLAVVFVLVQTNGVGVSLYEIREGELRGRWSGGDGKVWTEVCLVGKKA